MRDVEVRYARREGASLAFEVFGDGPTDVIVVKDDFPIDLMWELPQLAAFMDRLATFARVICYDDRGSGASDPVPSSGGIELWCDDLAAVLDAAGSAQATVFDAAHGPTGLVFAATYPERVQSMIVVNLRASFPELARLSPETMGRTGWTFPTIDSLRTENPRSAHDATLQRWWGRARRLQSSPQATAQLIRLAAAIDVSAVLSNVRIPTLVFHRTDNRAWDVESSRTTAARIPNARFVELSGTENSFYLGDTTQLLDEIEAFIAQRPVRRTDERALATIMFTDIVASTEHLAAAGDRAWRSVLDEHDRTSLELVATHRGRVIKTLGDGILATFDGPARAVRCALAIRDAAYGLGTGVRVGLHTGEIELRADDVTGIAVHTASRISSLAVEGEVLVSRTVVDLTAGSGLTFEDRGEHTLKGLPGMWPVFAAETKEPTATALVDR
jgi:class 3 adenylate cyclase